jgi:hypothetical protein
MKRRPAVEQAAIQLPAVQDPAHCSQVYAAAQGVKPANADRVRMNTAWAPVHVTNATLNTNPECRLLANRLFLLTNEMPSCYVGTSNPIRAAIRR